MKMNSIQIISKTRKDEIDNYLNGRLQYLQPPIFSIYFNFLISYFLFLPYLFLFLLFPFFLLCLYTNVHRMTTYWQKEELDKDSQEEELDKDSEEKKEHEDKTEKEKRGLLICYLSVSPLP